MRGTSIQKSGRSVWLFPFLTNVHEHPFHLSLSREDSSYQCRPRGTDLLVGWTGMIVDFLPGQAALRL